MKTIVPLLFAALRYNDQIDGGYFRTNMNADRLIVRRFKHAGKKPADGMASGKGSWM